MEIFVNGSVLAFSLEGEKKLGPVYTGLEEWAANGGKRIWSLQVDGKSFDPTRPDTFADVAVSGITRMDIAIGEKDAAREMAKRVNDFKASITGGITLVDEMVADIQQGREAAGKEKWPVILGIISEFHQVLHIFSDINTSSDKDSFEKEYIEFKNILKELHKTQELNDNVAFCDQLIYELKPQLEKWLDFLTITRSSIKKG